MSREFIVSIRSAISADEPVLWRMLTYAASVHGVVSEAEACAKADPYLRLYVEAWGTRDGDLGVVAADGDAKAVGAAWLRLMPSHAQHAVGDEAVPELATGVVPDLRGRGIGRRMMTTLIARATGRFEAISLAVREGNPAAGLYRSLGFRETRRIVNRVGGSSLVMQLNLKGLPPPRP